MPPCSDSGYSSTPPPPAAAMTAWHRPYYTLHSLRSSHLGAGFRARKMAVTGNQRRGSEGDVTLGERDGACPGPHCDRRGRATGQRCVSLRPKQLRPALVDHLCPHLTSQPLSRRIERREPRLRTKGPSLLLTRCAALAQSWKLPGGSRGFLWFVWNCTKFGFLQVVPPPIPETCPCSSALFTPYVCNEYLFLRFKNF